MVELSSDTKQAFGRMLVFLKTAQTADHSIYPFIVYASTLIVWTESGLKVLGKYKGENKAAIEEAKQMFKMAASRLAIQDAGQAGWQKAEIVRLSFEIDALIFPVAMTQGILVLNQEMINITAMSTGTGVDLGEV